MIRSQLKQKTNLSLSVSAEMGNCACYKPQANTANHDAPSTEHSDAPSGTMTADPMRSKRKAMHTLSVPSLRDGGGISNSRSRSPMTSNRSKRKHDVHMLAHAVQTTIQVGKGNGVTGTVINSLVVQIAADFWNKWIANKSMEYKLELSCAIFFEMLAHSETKDTLTRMMTHQSIENSSLQLFNMVHWLLQSLLLSDGDLLTMLRQLGIQHRNMGIDMRQLSAMLSAIHSTFSYYYPMQYGVQAKYAFNQIFSVAARLMTGEELTNASNESHAINLADELESPTFLESLSACLECSIGRTYLFRFMQQKFCDEIVIFFQSMKRFRQQTSDKERFMVAREVVKDTIQNDSLFCVNISHELRQSTLSKMRELERVFSEKEVLSISKDFFANVEREMKQLVMENHWFSFVATFKRINDACE